MRPTNDEEVLIALDRQTRGRGNGVKTADAVGMDPSHLRAVKSGRERISVKIAAFLGYELRWVPLPTRDSSPLTGPKEN